MTMSEILDEKFKNVKKTPGNQIWRIEKLEMCEVPEKDYGIFFGGDSYILLKTIEKKTGALERRIHFWLGEESSGRVHKFYPVLRTITYGSLHMIHYPMDHKLLSKVVVYNET